MAVQQREQAKAAPSLEELVARLRRAVSAAEEKRSEWRLHANMLVSTAEQLLRELGCEGLVLGDGKVGFWLMRIPKGEPDRECMYYAETEQGMTEEEARKYCTDREEYVVAHGIERLDARALDQLRTKLANVLEAVRLVRDAEELAKWLAPEDLAIASEARDIVEQFKARFCRG